jgi:hypothetical protein
MRQPALSIRGEGGSVFVVTGKDDARTLIVRDAQHEYLYVEVK